MAITGSDAKSISDLRDSLLSSQVDTSVIGETQSGPTSFFGGSAGASLAGVTPEMASNIAVGIEKYEERIRAVLNKLETVDSTAAFQGEGITQALSSFVEGIKKVSNDYLARLTLAEKEITASVATAYASQDRDVSGQLNSDTDTIVGGIKG